MRAGPICKTGMAVIHMLAPMGNERNRHNGIGPPRQRITDYDPPRGRPVLKDGNSLLQAYEPAMRDMTIFTLGHVC